MDWIDPLEETPHDVSLEPPRQPTHIGSVVQLVASVLLLLGSWLLAGILAFRGATVAVIRPDTDLLLAGDATLRATAAFVIGCVATINIFYSAYRLSGKSPRNETSIVFKMLYHPLVVLFVLGLSLIFGYAISSIPEIAWWGLPFAHFTANTSIIFLLLWVATRDMPRSSAQRSWGMFVSGMVLAPVLVIIVELLILVAFIIVVFLYLTSNPDYVVFLEQMAVYFNSGGVPSVNQLLHIAIPLLSDPFIIFLILLFAGVVAPLVENVFKPLGLWFLANRNLTPQEGFVLGAIGGAGYALYETLIMLPADDGWVMIFLARIGTSTIYVLTTGLIGWALVQAWQEKKYLRLVGVYAVSTLLHGAWNSFIILNALNTFLDTPTNNEFDSFWLAPHWVTTGIIGFFMLTLVAFGALFWLNKKFRPQSAEQKNKPYLEEKQTEE